jgi:hypothetical protein
VCGCPRPDECGCPSSGVQVSESGCVLVSESRCVRVRVQVCGCPTPGVRVSNSGCAGVRVRVRRYLSPDVRVSESGCARRHSKDSAPGDLSQKRKLRRQRDWHLAPAPLPGVDGSCAGVCHGCHPRIGHARCCHRSPNKHLYSFRCADPYKMIFWARRLLRAYKCCNNCG